jgi:hypothetical protein
VETWLERWWNFWQKIWREFWPDKETFHHGRIKFFQVVLLALGTWLGCRAGHLLAGIPDPIGSKISTVLVGLETTLLLGLLSGWLLETYVAVPYPEAWKNLNFERESGGPFLGFLERIIFFAAFWHSALLGGAWLAFKLGAKWGVWQHVIKYPETKSLDDMQEREQVGSRVLGRFLNGTLWNAVCGLIGAAITTVLWSFLNLHPDMPDMALKLHDALRSIK